MSRTVIEITSKLRMSGRLLKFSRAIFEDLRCAHRLVTSVRPRDRYGDDEPPPRMGGVWLGVLVGAAAASLLEGRRKVEAAVPTGPVTQSPRARFNFIAEVVGQCAPAVVYIEVKEQAQRRDLFGLSGQATSNGSGFIVRKDGLILTNAHVVVNRPRSVVSVKLQDGRVFTGKVEKVDMHSDLATVRIPVDDLPVMKLGTSSDIRTGEWVIALGSPLTLSNTVTAGVVSSTERNSDELGLLGKDMTYIQTDAAITFGNSGGPLVNLDGEAIGINSMKVASGISFAIPIDHAKKFLASSKDFGSVPVKRFLGLTMLTLTPTVLREIKQRTNQVSEDVKFGVLIYRIIHGSPAHGGGLVPGDIITKVNGADIHSARDLYDILEKTSGVLTLKIHRGHGTFEVKITPVEYNDYSH